MQVGMRTLREFGFVRVLLLKHLGEESNVFGNRFRCDHIITVFPMYLRNANKDGCCYKTTGNEITSNTNLGRHISEKISSMQQCLQDINRCNR